MKQKSNATPPAKNENRKNILEKDLYLKIKEAENYHPLSKKDWLFIIVMALFLFFLFIILFILK